MSLADLVPRFERELRTQARSLPVPGRNIRAVIDHTTAQAPVFYVQPLLGMPLFDLHELARLDPDAPEPMPQRGVYSARLRDCHTPDGVRHAPPRSRFDLVMWIKIQSILYDEHQRVEVDTLPPGGVTVELTSQDIFDAFYAPRSGDLLRRADESLRRMHAASYDIVYWDFTEPPSSRTQHVSDFRLLSGVEARPRTEGWVRRVVVPRRIARLVIGSYVGRLAWPHIWRTRGGIALRLYCYLLSAGGDRYSLENLRQRLASEDADTRRARRRILAGIRQIQALDIPGLQLSERPASGHAPASSRSRHPDTVIWISRNRTKIAAEMKRMDGLTRTLLSERHVRRRELISASDE